MRKLYMLRHTMGGVLHEHAFTSYPTAEQQAPIIEATTRLHGTQKQVKDHKGKVTKVIEFKFWVEEATLYDDGEVPAISAPNGGPGLAVFTLSGTGTVTPPK